MTKPTTTTRRPAAPKPEEQRLRLVGVTVQPRLVLDVDGVLTEVQAQPVTINASGWRDWCRSAFTEENLAAMLTELQTAEQ